MTVDDVKIAIKYCTDNGYDVRVRDIALIILDRTLNNIYFSYKVIFGASTDAEIDAYRKQENIKALNRYMDKYLSDPSLSDKDDTQLLETLNNNKLEMLKLIEEVDTAAEALEEKDGAEAIKLKLNAIKIKLDARVKFQDKFKPKDKNDNKKIIVYNKFNHICEWTRKECFLQTKEYAMEHWGLVDLEELKLKYNLIKK